MILALNPVAYYRLGDASGPLVDATGNGHELTVDALQLDQTGAINNDTNLAINCNGGRGYTNGAAFTLTYPFTFLLWMRPNGFFINCPFGKKLAYNFGVEEYALFYFLSDTPSFLGQGFGLSTPSGQWSLVSIVGIDATHHRFGVNKTYNSGGGFGALPGNTGLEFSLGNTQSKNAGFDGKLDEFAFINSALSTVQIDALYDKATEVLP